MRKATRQRGCVGKLRHADQAGARAHVARRVAEGAARERLSTYRCRHCGGWHVGHSWVRS